MKYTMPIIFLLTIGVTLITGCSQGPIKVPGAELIISAASYERNPQISDDDLAALVNANNDFAIDLYRELVKENENVFFSPYSFTQDLAMLMAGTDGVTKSQLIDAMYYSDLEKGNIHKGFNKLNHKLQRDKGVTFVNSNSIWTQVGNRWKSEYLDVLKENYNSGIYETDFINDSNSTMNAMDEWIKIASQGHFKSMLSEGDLNGVVSVVLLNAVYFDGIWEHQFDKDDTWMQPFMLLDETSVDVNMMHNTLENYRYFIDENVISVEMPYKDSDIAMLVVMPSARLVTPSDPDSGFIPLTKTFSELEENLTTESLANIIDNLERARLNLAFPRIEMSSNYDFESILEELSINDAYIPGTADFSRMSESELLFLSKVIQDANLLITEEGTRAIATTGVEVVKSALILEIWVCSPFIFIIRDTKTNTILFMGRVTDPSKLTI